MVILLGSIIAVGPMSIDLYLPAFPQLTELLQTGARSVQLSLTAFLIGMAVGQIVIGPLSDAVGRRKPLVIGMIAYTLASLLCMISPTIEVLIASRLLQGLSGSVGAVMALALVRDMFDGPQLARMMSRLILVMGAAPVFAPMLGGWLLNLTGWRGLFGVLAGFGLVMTVVVAVFVSETLHTADRQHPGVRQTARSYRQVLADRRYLGYAAIQVSGFVLIFGYVSGSSFAYQEVHQVSEQVYGMLFGLNAVGQVIASQVNAWLVLRRDAASILRRTLPVTVLGAAALVLTTTTGFGGLSGLAVPMFVIMTTVGLILPNAGALALNRHPHNAGTAAAFVGMAQFAIGSLVGPVVSSFGTGSAAPMAIVIAVGVTSMVLLSVVVGASDRRRGVGSWDPHDAVPGAADGAVAER